MNRNFKVSLYYKLFLIYGLTFLGLVQLVGDSMTRPFEIDDLDRIVLQLGAAVALVIANALIVKHLLRPLTTLAEISKDFSAGNFRLRVPVDSTDEIGDLTRAMNAMADKIQIQLESLKHMAVGVSHEVRTPLTRMRVVVEMLPESEQKKILTGQIQELDGITGAILEREALNSGLSEIKQEPVSLPSLLSEMTRDFAISDLIIEFENQAGELEILGDRRRLEMCIKNLIDNAFKHGSDQNPVKVLMRRQDGFVVLEIRNHQSDQRKSPSNTGFGLGLSLSQSIATVHGGMLNLVNADGLVTATLTMPLRR